MSSFTPHLRIPTALLCLAGLSFNSALAQVPAQPVVQSPAQPNRLFIQILDGEGALNDIRSRTAREPIVQIEDENHKPIAGAVVIFSTPDSGPSAIFSNGLHSFKATTGEDGRATAELKPNTVSGAFQIQVAATFGALSSVAVINQTNTGKTSSVQSHAAHGLPIKVIAIVGGIAVGAGVATGLLLSNGSHSTTVTPGTPTVGAP